MKLRTTQLCILILTPYATHAMKATEALGHALHEMEQAQRRSGSTSHQKSGATDHQQICAAFAKKDMRAIDAFIKKSSDLVQNIINQNANDPDGDYLRITSLLELACENNLGEVISQLRTRGVSIAQPDESGNTPLARCLARGVNDKKTLFFLITEETINRQNKQMRTPLHILLNQNEIYKSALEALCEEGARLDIQDDTGNTPLHYAALRGGSGKLIEHLMNPIRSEEQKIALINMQNKQGATALHLAIQNYLDAPDASFAVNTIKYLLNYGSLSVANIEGVTPMDLVYQLVAQKDPRALKLESFLDEYYTQDNPPADDASEDYSSEEKSSSPSFAEKVENFFKFLKL